MSCVGTCGQLHPVVMLNDSFPVRLMRHIRPDAHGANPHFSLCTRGDRRGGTPIAKGGTGPPTARKGGGPAKDGRGELTKSKRASGGSGDITAKSKLIPEGATLASKKEPSTPASK